MLEGQVRAFGVAELPKFICSRFYITPSVSASHGFGKDRLHFSHHHGGR